MACIARAARLTGMRSARARQCSRVNTVLLSCALAASVDLLSGCTVFPEKKLATLETTTSAEQVQRIFWQDVAGGKWVQANALLAPKAVWRVGSRVLPREQIIPWLQAGGIRDVQVSGVALEPAVNDMNLVYTLQVQGAHALGGGAECAGQPQTWSALAVWQQPQPSAAPPAKDDKQDRGYLLTVHDLAPTGKSACH
jgi:hypothetical protein